MSETKNELSYEDFVRARTWYWEQEAKRSDSKVVLPKSEKIELTKDDGGFILSSPGSNGILAIFELGPDAGWFYLYEATQKRILQSAHIYNRRDVAVAEDEIDIGWSTDDSVCGLAVFGQFRAFLGVSGDLEIRKPLSHSDQDGIPEQNWPAGFEHYLEKRID